MTGCPVDEEPWDDVFLDMLTSEACMPDRFGALRPAGINLFRTSCTVRLSCQEYHFNNTLEIPRATYFVGCGHGDGYLPTQFRFACDTLGVWMPGFDSGSGTYNGTIDTFSLGAGQMLERVEISTSSRTCSLDSMSTAHGILSAGRIFLDRVRVTNMQGHALFFSTPNGGNPSLSSVHRFEAQQNGGRCLFVDGPDGNGANNNQMAFFEMNCTGNCRAFTNGGTQTSTSCEEYREQGKLGNVHFALHINNALVPNIYSVEPSARTQLFGAYVEDGVPGIDSTIRNMDLYGGQGEPLNPGGGSGFGIWGGSFRGLNQWRTASSGTLRLGDSNFAPGALLGAQGTDNSRFSLRHLTGAFELKTGLTSIWGLRMSTALANEVQIPRLLIGGGNVNQGSGSPANILTVDDCANPPDPVDWPQGSLAACTDAQSGATGMLFRCQNSGVDAWCPVSIGSALP